MCDECKTVFGAIANREVRCRTSGCKKTWTWGRGDSWTPASPASRCPRRRRACARAASISTASSRTSSGPAAGPSCKRTWTDKRGAQLARAVRGKTGDPYPHYCAECEKELGELEDRQVPCKTDHCTGTWTWTSAQQLAAGVRPVVKDEKDEARTGAEAAATERAAAAEGHTRATPRAASTAAPPNGAEAPAAGTPAAAAPRQAHRARARAERGGGATASAAASRGRPSGAARPASSSSRTARRRRSPARAAPP